MPRCQQLLLTPLYRLSWLCYSFRQRLCKGRGTVGAQRAVSPPAPFLSHSFCTPCLQECLKPKKPVCGVCRSTLSPGSRALDLEKQIETTETTCNGCNKKVRKCLEIQYTRCVHLGENKLLPPQLSATSGQSVCSDTC